MYLSIQIQFSIILSELDLMTLARGTSISTQGKATAKALINALNQSMTKRSATPRFMKVMTPNIMKDIINDIKKAKTMA